MRMIELNKNDASAEHQNHSNKSLNESESEGLSPLLKKKANISIFKEFLLGDQVFDEIFEEENLVKQMRNRKIWGGSFKRKISQSKIVQFIKHHFSLRFMFIIFLTILYTLFFIIPKSCPFAICILIGIKFAYYDYMHRKIHERSDNLGITPVFTGSVFGSLLIWVARKKCSICSENKKSKAVFKYYKSSSKEVIKSKSGCSLPILP